MALQQRLENDLFVGRQPEDKTGKKRCIQLTARIGNNLLDKILCHTFVLLSSVGFGLFLKKIALLIDLLLFICKSIILLHFSEYVWYIKLL